MADDWLRIDQVAERTGLTKRALRYYEEIGLLDPPTRTEGNYRLYSEADVAHIARIRRMRELLGASLAEIKEMVAVEEAREQVKAEWDRDPDPRARLERLARADALVRRQLALVDEKLAGLQEMRETLLARLVRYTERRADLARLIEGTKTN
jgi:MerR family transcriptional regulator, repressor of the yfmOP operon